MDSDPLPGAPRPLCVRCYPTPSGYVVEHDSIPLVFPTLAAAMAYTYATCFTVTPLAG